MTWASTTPRLISFHVLKTKRHKPGRDHPPLKKETLDLLENIFQPMLDRLEEQTGVCLHGFRNKFEEEWTAEMPLTYFLDGLCIFFSYMLFLFIYWKQSSLVSSEIKYSSVVTEIIKIIRLCCMNWVRNFKTFCLQSFRQGILFPRLPWGTVVQNQEAH